MSGTDIDLRLVCLCEVARGADYAYLASKNAGEHLGIRIRRRQIQRTLRLLERDGLLVSSLDGDAGAPPDQWVRRLYSLTEEGQRELEHRLAAYGTILCLSVTTSPA